MKSKLKFYGNGLKLVYLQCYFVTIATILGTGILGLPVTLSHSGLYPFLVSFIGGFLVQALLIVFFADLLQRSHAAQLQNVDVVTAEHMPLNNFDVDVDDEFVDVDDINESDENNSNFSRKVCHLRQNNSADPIPPDLFLNTNSIINPNYVEPTPAAPPEVTSRVPTDHELLEDDEGGAAAWPGGELVLISNQQKESRLKVSANSEENGPVLAGHVIIPRETSARAPNLHLLGELFLCQGMRQLFYLVLFVQFVALLTSYALAGSEAYAQILGVNYVYVIPVFVWILTVAVVFALNFIQPLVSLLTFAKGSLLLATVVVTFLVGASIQQHVTNDFNYMGAPFLMGTVALGGVVNVMPFLYGKIAPIASQVRNFRMSILLGLFTCTILNVLWCWAVLDIVPQLDGCFNKVHHASNISVFHIVVSMERVCLHNFSLQNSAQQGEISTIPLTKIIHEVYPVWDWVALLVELFIMISITVSFLTMGAAMHHSLSGLVESLFSKDRISSYASKVPVPPKLPFCNCKSISRTLLSLSIFTIVFGIAISNPKGFEALLEKAASLFINLEAGVFIFMMIAKATHGKNRRLQIPLPLPNWIYHTQYLIPLYFGFAIGYDVYLLVLDLLLHGRIARYPDHHVVTDDVTGTLNTTSASVVLSTVQTVVQNHMTGSTVNNFTSNHVT